MATAKQRKPTPKQLATAKVAVEALNNKEVLTKRELVAKGGYGEVVQRNPYKALETEGYRNALAEYGLTDELVTCALVEDIEKKPQNRVQELKLGAEILGMKDDIPQKGNTFNTIIFADGRADKIAKRILGRGSSANSTTSEE